MSEQVKASLVSLDTAVSKVLTRASAAEANAVSAAALAVGIEESRAEPDSSGLRGQQLGAISKVITGNVVDVCIYDTAQDSDGGAWRFNSEASWYNEPLGTLTRGLRREFPSVAIIAVEGSKVTIFDADNPDLPMWMMAHIVGQNSPTHGFTAIGGQSLHLKSVAAGQAQICITGMGGYSSQGLLRWDFAKDRFGNHGGPGWSGWAGTMAERLNIVPNDKSLPAIVNSYVRDVAITTLPSAPLDPETGLQIPTIVCATDGGVSVIRDDGTVVDLTDGTGEPSFKVAFTDDNKLAYIHGEPNAGFRIDSIPDADFSIGPNKVLRHNSEAFYLNDNLLSSGWGGGVPYLNSNSHVHAAHLTPAGRLLAYGAESGGGGGLQLVGRGAEQQFESLFCQVTEDFITGYQTGDNIGAWLADSDTSDVGRELLSADQRSLTNFSALYGGVAKDGTNHPDPDGGTGATKIIHPVDDGENGYFFFDKGLAAGIPQVREVWLKGTGTVRWGAYQNSQVVGQSIDIPLTSTWQKFYFYCETSGTRAFQIQEIRFGDEVYVYAPSARTMDNDRSVKNKGLVPTGTITRAPVAEGAELVRYSGFSTSNYLKQPYSADLDFGTGDFCIMGWANTPSPSTYAVIFDRSSSTGTLRLVSGSTGVRLQLSEDGMATYVDLHADSVQAANQDTFWVALRRGTALEIFKDGKLVKTGTSARNVSSTDAPVWIGNRADGYPWPATGSLALFRLSKTAPTAEQIRFMYEQEKRLFQPGARFSLPHDQVNDLAYDDETNLLHVATPGGRASYDGLLKVEETNTATSLVRANAGLLIED